MKQLVKAFETMGWKNRARVFLWLLAADYVFTLMSAIFSGTFAFEMNVHFLYPEINLPLQALLLGFCLINPFMSMIWLFARGVALLSHLVFWGGGCNIDYSKLVVNDLNYPLWPTVILFTAIFVLAQFKTLRLYLLLMLFDIGTRIERRSVMVFKLVKNLYTEIIARWVARMVSKPYTFTVKVNSKEE